MDSVTKPSGFFKKIVNFESVATLLFVFFTSGIAIFPHIWAYLMTPSGYFFTGVGNDVNFTDVQGVYFAAMRNFSLGDWLYINPFDFSLPPFFHYPVYLLLGKFVAFSGVSVQFVYHMASFLLSIPLLLFIFKFLRVFFENFVLRTSAFLLAVFGALYSVNIAEGVGLFSLSVPHYIVAQLGIFMCLYYLYRISVRKWVSTKEYVMLLVANVLVVLSHPWMTMPLLVLCFFLIVLHFWQKKPIRSLLVSLAILIASSFPFLLYYKLNVFWVDQLLRGFLLLLPQVYGFDLLFAIIGLILAVVLKGDGRFRFIAMWFVIQILFLFGPFSFSRRYMDGLYLPMAILATCALQFLSRRYSTWVILLPLLFLTVGSFSHYSFFYTWIPNDFVYRRIEERDAIDFLNKNAGFSQIVFSHPTTSNFIAGHARVHVYMGYPLQTTDSERKFGVINSYFRGDGSADWRRALLEQDNICYVYVGPLDKTVLRWDIAKEPYLTRVFGNKEVDIYRTQWCIT